MGLMLYILDILINDRCIVIVDPEGKMVHAEPFG